MQEKTTKLTFFLSLSIVCHETVTTATDCHSRYHIQTVHKDHHTPRTPTTGTYLQDDIQVMSPWMNEVHIVINGI